MTQPQGGQTKPLPELAFWLAVQHQKAQQEIADKTAAGLALLWAILQFDKLEVTTPAWLHAVTLQVEQQFRVSERTAFEFVQGSKWAVEPFADPLELVRTRFPTKDFQLAMRATGPATVKAATGRAFAAPVGDSGGVLGQPAPEVPQVDYSAVKSDVMALGKLTSTGAAVKQTLNGGRGEVQQLVVIDARDRFANRQAIGWARFTEDSATGPCYFCAVLASQGAVYYGGDSFDRSNSKIRDFGVPADVAGLMAKLDARGEKLGLSEQRARRAFVGDGPAKVHDHCKCTIRPVYREEDAMDERATNFLDQWSKSPGTSLNEFRKRYQRPKPYADNPAVNLDMVRRNRDAVVAELGSWSPQALWWNDIVSRLQSANLLSA